MAPITDDNIAGALVIPHAVFSVLATIFVVLRWYTQKYVTHAKWEFDSTVLVVALTANHAMLIVEGIGARYGLGQDMALVETLPTGAKGLLLSILGIEITYGISCPLSKLAVLTMYYRIFSSSRVLRYTLWVIASMLVGWGIAVVMVSIFTCDPVQGFWDPSIERVCIDSSKFYIGITVPNIVFDALTVGLPVYEIWKLKMGRSKKMAISGIFLLGGSVVLASIARLVLFIIYKPGGGTDGNNLSRTVIIPHAASAIETALAIIGACLPPSTQLFLKFTSALRSSIGSSKRTNNNNTPPQLYFSRLTIGKISNRGGKKRRRPDEGSLSWTKTVISRVQRMI